MNRLRQIIEMWNWWNRQGRPCLFRFFTGFYCPGCGGTRAFLSLMKGRWVLSYFQNPIVILTAWILCLEGISLCLEKTGKKRNPDLAGYRLTGYIALGLGFLIFNWIFKNLGLFWGIDLLTYAAVQ